MRESHTPYFEVHRLLRRRWRLDAIFADRQSAIEDAKRLMQAPRGLEAVRVLRVEEQDQGFLEWTVYLAGRPRAQRSWRRYGSVVALRAAPQRQRRRAGVSRGSALLLAGLVIACGLLLLSAPRPRPADAVWVFDRPEAWQPHPLRNPWTGEVSKPEEKRDE